VLMLSVVVTHSQLRQKSAIVEKASIFLPLLSRRHHCFEIKKNVEKLIAIFVSQSD